MTRRAFARVAIGVLLAAGATGVAGCKASEASKALKDSHGERIVSISPSTTEAVYAVGAGDRLVGRSRYCDYPPEVARLPQVGGFVDPSLEAILALTPDLVIGGRGPAGDAITKKLEGRGIPTFFPKTETLAEIDAMILGVGDRTDRATAAKAFVDGIHAHLRAIDGVVASLPKKRVLLVFGLEPLSVAGAGSFPDEMIRRAGGTNVVTAGGAYPTISVEHVLSLDPDVVVNAAMAEAKGHDVISANAPGWSRVRAVTQGHVVRLTDESVLRPGPRIADGIAVLATAIHPETKIP